MIDINLLPEELAPNKKYQSVSNKIIKGLVVWFIILLIGSGAAFAYTISLKRKVEESMSNQEDLKTSIKALQETEQRLILIKDRLDKISLIENKEGSWNDVKNLKTIVENFPNGVSYKNSSIEPENVDINVVVTDSIALSDFFLELIYDSPYKKINLDSMEFSKQEGYEINVNLSN